MVVSISRGEIWLVSLDPTEGHEIKKTRPAVIIQNDIGNKYSALTIIAPIISQDTNKVYPFEVLLTPQNAGLEKESKALLNQIRAIDKKRLIKKIGKITTETREEIDEALKISLDLK